MTIKNRLFSWGVALLCGACVLGSCSDDDDNNSPYAGTDAHILSLSLTATDGTVYEAAITDKTLTVCVPGNVSLDGAKVAYELCEHASILPDPASVTDWDEEQLFRVVSYNGQTVENYTYVIEREEVQSEGSVTLTTQTELDAFAAKQVEVVAGNLVIGSAMATDDPIRSLKNLSSLKRVKGNLIILSSYEGGNLVGLENISELGGIMVGTADNLATITTDINMSLPGVKQIGDILVHSNSVKTLELPSITSVSSLSVRSRNLTTVDLSSLVRCSGDFSFGFSATASRNAVLEKLLCPALKQVEGDFVLQYLSTLATVDFTALERIGGACKYVSLDKLEAIDMPALSEFSGDLTLTSLLAVTEINLPKVALMNSLSMSGGSDWATETVDFSSLQSVTNNLALSARLSSLTQLSLPSLTTVGGAVTLSNMPNVEVLDLPELAETGNLTATNLNSLQTFSLPQWTVAKAISLTLPALQTLDIPMLSSFTGMTLNSLNSLTELRFPDSFSTFNGTLTIGASTSLERIYGPSVYTGRVTVNLSATAGTPVPAFVSSAADGLVTMQGDLQYSASNRRDDLVMAGVKAVNGRLTLPSAASLTVPDLQTLGSLSMSNTNNNVDVAVLAMPELETVTGDFYVGYKCANSYELPKLKTIGGSLRLGATQYYPNNQLTNLDDFKGWTQVGRVEITYQAALADFSGLAGMIGNFTGSWSVRNNMYNPTLDDMKNGQYTQP